MSAVADNLALIQERIAAAAERSGRRAEEITLVAVTKKQPASALREAQAAGATDVGENYVQETIEKQKFWEQSREEAPPPQFW
ncbi:MAG: YggS family pyridoxal phosphate enzyme, partial [Armatimonadota bacterium]|nr:YggS family pyridoxal phosphate enzyme [Armatimonadota bacterium]